MTENYYEARLSLIVKGDAKNRAAFFTELDKILDAWQDLGDSFDTPLTWDDAEATLTYASAPPTPCPNHEGAFDCNPFCSLCEGDQEL